MAVEVLDAPCSAVTPRSPGFGRRFRRGAARRPARPRAGSRSSSCSSSSRCSATGSPLPGPGRGCEQRPGADAGAQRRALVRHRPAGPRRPQPGHRSARGPRSSSRSWSVALPMLIGVPLGAVAGYRGGWIDDVIMRIDRPVPGLPAAAAGDGHRRRARPPASSTPPSRSPISWWPWYTRLVRGHGDRRWRERPFVEAARAIGVQRAGGSCCATSCPTRSTPDHRPGDRSTSAASSSRPAALAFLGLGAQAADAGLGPDGRPRAGPSSSTSGGCRRSRAWPSSLAALAFNLVGDGLRDVLDPRQVAMSGRCSRSDDLRVAFVTPDGDVRPGSTASSSRSGGEIVGLVGETGCGKTLTGLAVLGLLPRTARITRRDPARRPATCSACPTPSCAASAARRIGDGLPEPGVGVQPGVHASASRWGRARGARAADGARRPGTDPRDPRRRGMPDAERVMRLVPAPALGRHAPARDDREALLCRPAPAHRRRAHHRAGRDHRGPDPAAHRAACSEERGFSRAASSPTTWARASVSDRVVVLYAGRVAESAPTERAVRAAASIRTR